MAEGRGPCQTRTGSDDGPPGGLALRPDRPGGSSRRRAHHAYRPGCDRASDPTQDKHSGDPVGWHGIAWRDIAAVPSTEDRRDRGKATAESGEVLAGRPGMRWERSPAPPLMCIWRPGEGRERRPGRGARPTGRPSDPVTASRTARGDSGVSQIGRGGSLLYEPEEMNPTRLISRHHEIRTGCDGAAKKGRVCGERSHHLTGGGVPDPQGAVV
jgi:hypothetical protein